MAILSRPVDTHAKSGGTAVTIDRGAGFRALGGGVRIDDDCWVKAYSVLPGHAGLDISNKAMIASHVSSRGFTHTFGDDSMPMNKTGLRLKQ